MLWGDTAKFLLGARMKIAIPCTVTYWQALQHLQCDGTTRLKCPQTWPVPLKSTGGLMLCVCMCVCTYMCACSIYMWEREGGILYNVSFFLPEMFPLFWQASFSIYLCLSTTPQFLPMFPFPLLTSFFNLLFQSWSILFFCFCTS
jgi:hypothetical protein